MSVESLKALSKEEIKAYITNIWEGQPLWDGSAGNAYVSVEVLGSTLDDVKEALITLIKDFGNNEVEKMLVKDCLYLHESSLVDDGYIRMAYWKGCCYFACTLSKVLPEALVICEDEGWYGTNECVIAKKGKKAIPGRDYIGDMEYCINQDIDDDEEVYYDVDLQIMDAKGHITSVGGGMISEEDTENYKKWANKVEKVEDINWERNSNEGD